MGLRVNSEDNEPEITEEDKSEKVEEIPETQDIVRLIPTLENTDSLSHYIREINKFPMLESQDEYELAKAWVEKADNQAAKKIVQSHLRLVTKIAAGYKGYGLPINDLIAEGNIGILQALRRFDPSKGFRFSTYAMWWIKASIKDYIMRTWSLVKIGTTAAQKKLFFGLKSTKKKLGLGDGVGLTPETAEKIAQELSVTKEEVMEMDKRLSGADYSLNVFVGEDNESEWQDWLTDEEMSHDQKLAEKDELDKRRQLFEKALDCLDEREHVILSARRLHEPPRTLDEISQDYNISRERVRQIEMRAFEKLQKHIRDQISKQIRL